MRIEDIIKIIWRRGFLIISPMLLVPLFAMVSVRFVAKEYRSETMIFINQSAFKHPKLMEYGIKIDLEERLPAIKKMLIGESRIYKILGQPKPNSASLEYLVKMEKIKERMKIELKGPGVTKISYSGFNPQDTKEVVEKMTAHYLEIAFLPFKGIGLKIRENLVRRDEILNNQLLPGLVEADARFFELEKSYTHRSPELMVAKYERDLWQGKVNNRKEVILQKVSSIIPLKGDDIEI
ncbi:MAG: hypothetical protein GY786_16080, partial [Proteobacteria bacterium]|nr:hypothetical protein [Pseudomonadota bacterium]